MAILDTSSRLILLFNFFKMFKKALLPLALSLAIFILFVNVAEAAGGGGEAGMKIAETFLWIAIILLVAKVASLVRKIGQQPVLGELVAGVILGNLVLLAGLDVLAPISGFLGLFEQVKGNEIIHFLAELGVVVLLFQIGLESNIHEIKKVGWSALAVAILGVAVPFVLGAFVAGPLFFPEASSNMHIFLGAALTATSVGITARVFQDLGQLKTKCCQIILSAAVLDDVFGLIILAVVSALVKSGSVDLATVALVTGKALGFLVAAIVVGRLAAVHISRFLSKISSGAGMKFTLAISFGLILAYLAQVIGLAGIVGAFAAGLVLDPVHFRFFKKPKVVEDIEGHANGLPEDSQKKVNQSLEEHSHKHVEDLLEPIGFFVIPIFFVVTGAGVTLEALFNVNLLLIALAITVIAIIGKLVAGLAAPKNANRLAVGFGMVPRGEVGLIFAAIGRSIGVINDEVFSVLVVVVMLTTLITPMVLSRLLKKKEAAK